MSGSPLRSLLVVSCVIASVLAPAGCRRAPPRTRLVVAYPRGPLDVLPWRTNDEISNAVLRHVYEPLVDFGPDLGVKPCLAGTWYNPDELTWVFRLQRDVLRHDGRPLLAQDVARFFVEVHRDPQVVRGASDVVSVEAPDPHTLVFRTGRPIGWLPTLLARQLIALPAEAAGGFPVGTGPYQLRKWSPGGDTQLEAFAEHRQGAPPIAQLDFAAMDLSAAVEALRRGSVHLMLDVPGPAWSVLQFDHRFETWSQPGLRVYYLQFDLFGSGSEQSPVRELRVREAIAHAVDRSELLTGALAGTGEPIAALLPPAVFGHHETLQPRSLDRPLARRLLADAGFATGLELSLQVGLQPGNRELAAGLAAQLERVGIRLRLVDASDPAAPPEGPEPAPPDMYLLGWLHSSGDAGASYEHPVHSPQRGAAGSSSRYANPEVDRLIEAAARPAAMRARREPLLRIAEIVDRDVALLALYRQLDRYAYQRGLAFSPRLGRRIRAQEIHWLQPPASALLE